MCYGCTMCDACGKVTRMRQILAMRDCPSCRREVPGFITECPNCGTELEYIEPGDATLLAYKSDMGMPGGGGGVGGGFRDGVGNFRDGAANSAVGASDIENCKRNKT